MAVDDSDEVRPKPAPGLQIDLSSLSIDELDDRIRELKDEIERCEAAIKSKKLSHSDAESVFKL